MTSKVFIDGEAGTTGLLIRDLLVERAGIELLEIEPALRKDVGERRRLLHAADVAILCLPDAAAKESVALLDGADTRVIDASSAHRVADGWTYGFPEISAAQSEAIAGARRVANPGCWPQGAIAFLHPLVRAGLLPADHPVTVHGVSGYSGGGRQMIADHEAAGEGASSYAPYALGLDHKHLPELRRYAGLASRPLFLPAVGGFAQGMMVVLPLHLDALDDAPSRARLHEAVADHHAAQPGGVVDVAPLGDDLDGMTPTSLVGSDRMRLHVFGNDAAGHAVLIAVYDNLGKGAAGAAVQNLELMLGGG